MPLRNRPADLKALIRKYADPPARRTVHSQIDDDLGVQSVGAGGEIHQAAQNDMVGPAGFFCRQAADDEEITVSCQAGDVVVAFRVTIPSDVSSAGAHEPVLFDANGNRIRCNGPDGPEITVGAGVCKVRSDGAATGLLALAAETKAEIKTLRDWCMAHSHASHGAASVPTPSVVGDVACTKLEAE